MKRISHEQMELLRELADREVLGASQVAGILGYSRVHIYRLVRQGRIPVHRPNGGRLVFLKSEILDCLKNS